MEYKIRKITYVNDVYSNLPNTLLHLKTKLDDDISKNQRFNKSVFMFLSCVIYLGAYDIRHFENTEREREKTCLQGYPSESSHYQTFLNVSNQKRGHY
jgi:hypothetical protein